MQWFIKIVNLIALTLLVAMSCHSGGNASSHHRPRTTTITTPRQQRSAAANESRNNFYSLDDDTTQLRSVGVSGESVQSGGSQSAHRAHGRGTSAVQIREEPVEDDRTMSGGSQTNCSVCPTGSASERDVKRTYRIESIKADILRKLHLRSPPNVTGIQLPALPHIQRFIDQVNHSSHFEDDEDDGATTMRVIQVSKLGQ